MKKLNFLLVILFMLGFAAQAQTPIKFRKVLGDDDIDYGYSAQQTLDSGYILVGSTATFSNSSDMYAIKTDSMGIPRMNKTFGGINIEKGLSIRQTSDKGYIMLGYTNSFGAGGYDMYLVKVDSGFNTQWEKTYGGADWDFGNCVKQTNDGGYILCGSTYSYGNGFQDYYLVKTNSTGDTIWTKTFGGAYDDIAKSVVQTADGGYLLTGVSNSMSDTLGNFYTIRTNSLGDTLWTNVYGGAQADAGNSLIESLSGDVYIAGERTYSGDTDGTIERLSASGAYVSDYRFPAGSSYDNFNYISQTADGKLALAGTTNSLGPNGDVLEVILRADYSFFSSTTFGYLETDKGFSIEPTADKGFIICGHTTSFHNGLEDIYLIKTDSMGMAGFTGSESFYMVGINDFQNANNNQFVLFPNPANNNATLVFTDAEFVEKSLLIIADLQGRIVLQQELSGSNEDLALENLANGLYTITVKNERFSSSKKLIIQH